MNHAVVSLALLLALSAPPSPAQSETRSAYTAPREFVLAERSDGQLRGHSAVWRTKASLTGTLVVEFNPRDPAKPVEERKLGEVRFEPDHRSLNRMPQAVGNFYPLAPTSVWVENAEPLPILGQLLGQEQASALAKGREEQIRLEVVLGITELGTSIDCDQRHFAVKYVQVRLQERTKVASGPAREGGC